MGTYCEMFYEILCVHVRPEKNGFAESKRGKKVLLQTPVANFINILQS